MYHAMLQKMADNDIVVIIIAEQSRTVPIKLIALFIFHAIDVYVYENVAKQVVFYCKIERLDEGFELPPGLR